MKIFPFTSSPRKAITLIMLIYICGHATGQPTREYGAFRISSDEVIWEKIFEEPQLSAQQLTDRIAAQLEIKSIVRNVKRQGNGTFTASIENLTFDHKKMGKLYLFSSDMITDGRWSGRLRIDVKDGKYRVTVYKLSYIIPQQESPWGKKPERNSQGQGTLTEAAVNQATLEFKRSCLLDLDLISLTLFDHFRLAITQDQLFSQSWE